MPKPRVSIIHCGLSTSSPIKTDLGFTKDIGASPDDLNQAVSLFFITFVVLQPVSAAVGRWVGANHWIPLMMVIVPMKHIVGIANRDNSSLGGLSQFLRLISRAVVRQSSCPYTF